MPFPAATGKRTQQQAQGTASSTSSYTPNPELTSLLKLLQSQALQNSGAVTSASPLTGLQQMLMGGGAAGAGGAAPMAGLTAGGGAAAAGTLAGILPGFALNQGLVQPIGNGLQFLGQKMQGLPMNFGHRNYGEAGANLGQFMAGFGSTVGGKPSVTSTAPTNPMPAQTEDTSPASTDPMARSIDNVMSPQPSIGATDPMQRSIDRGVGLLKPKMGLAQQLRGDSVGAPTPPVTNGYRGGKPTPNPAAPLQIDMPPLIINGQRPIPTQDEEDTPRMRLNTFR